MREKAARTRENSRRDHAGRHAARCWPGGWPGRPPRPRSRWPWYRGGARQAPGDAADRPGWEHSTARDRPVTALQYPFSTGWVFGEYARGSEQPGYDDTQLTPVTLPHCVTKLSWQKWNPAAWQRVWVYRRSFDGTGLLNGRVLVDLDGVMVNATVIINGRTAASSQGRLPAVLGRADRLPAARRQRARGGGRRPLHPGPAGGPGRAGHRRLPAAGRDLP